MVCNTPILSKTEGDCMRNSTHQLWKSMLLISFLLFPINDPVAMAFSFRHEFLTIKSIDAKDHSHSILIPALVSPNGITFVPVSSSVFSLLSLFENTIQWNQLSHVISIKNTHSLWKLSQYDHNIKNKNTPASIIFQLNHVNIVETAFIKEGNTYYVPDFVWNKVFSVLGIQNQETRNQWELTEINTLYSR